MLAQLRRASGGEIARLRLGDVDLREQTIDIRETKFFKNRRLPLASGVMAALSAISSCASEPKRRRIRIARCSGVPQRNRGYTVGGIRLVLTDVLRRADVKPARGAVGARIHDLRHVVSHRMRDWYKSE
ncbi:MAG: tyrosine-type recombinase/integrase [Sterolibacteriaceae bacterium]|nr:tyrosine-type recombinase/integrase [Sterolibacteriaceae bacterium]